MGLYQRWIVPRLIDLAMRNHSLDAYRQRTTISAASGVVLEIGVGSGQNLAFYRSAVDHVLRNRFLGGGAGTGEEQDR
jgi:hypothetical protein